MGKNKSKKGKKLANNTQHPSALPLTSEENSIATFKVVFAGKAQRNYDFKDCDMQQWHQFGEFIDATVGKKITEVNERYKRNPDRSDKVKDPLGDTYKIEHYEVNNQSRIHGYFINRGYFIVTRLDPKHKVHKRK